MAKPTVNCDDDGERDSRQRDAAHPPAIRKKAYQKPVLSKHEQLHGIGLGTS